MNTDAQSHTQHLSRDIAEEFGEDRATSNAEVIQRIADALARLDAMRHPAFESVDPDAAP
jgi:hypothetical protein